MKKRSCLLFVFLLLIALFIFNNGTKYDDRAIKGVKKQEEKDEGKKVDMINLALNSQVFSDSAYSKKYRAYNACDGDRDTIWASTVDASSDWIFVDLGDIRKINGITLKWFDKYYAKKYLLYGSNDKKEWQVIIGEKVKKAKGDDLFIGLDILYRYVALLCIMKNDAAYGLGEFEINQIVTKPTATPEQATPTIEPTIKPTSTPVVTATPDTGCFKWMQVYNYEIGHCVEYEGKNWICIHNHRSNYGWTPSNTVGILWELR